MMIHSLRTRLFIFMLLVGLAAVAAAIVFAAAGARSRLQDYLRQRELFNLYRAATLFELQAAALPAPLAPGEAQLWADDLAALHGVHMTWLPAARAAALSPLLPPGRDVLSLQAPGGAPGLLYALPDAADPGAQRVVLASDSPRESQSWALLDPSTLPASLQSVTVVRREQSGGETTTTTEQRAVVQGLEPEAASGEQVLLQALNRTFLAALGAALALAVVLSFVLSRHIVRPLRALTRAALAMEQGQLNQRVAVRGRDELAELGRAFNAMGARLEDTVAALRRFAADAAHELQTPLTALRTNVELAASEPDAARRDAFLAETTAQVARLERLTRNLLDLSLLEAGSAGAAKRVISLHRLLCELGEIYASRAEQNDVHFTLSLPSYDLRVAADATALRQALGNLLDNALKFTPPGRHVELALAAEEGTARITVTDSGIGLAPEDAPYLFTRFHRGRNAASFSGSGLGLAIVKATMDQHGGVVQAQALARGARFIVSLPLALQGGEGA